MVSFYAAAFQGTTSSSSGQSSSVTFSASETTTDVASQTSLPREYVLDQNYPNPFNPSTTIAFSVPEGTKNRLDLRVFDLSGKEVATLIDGFVGPGYHQVSLDATRLASGVYFYRLQAGSYGIIKKLVIMK
jgi:hypothetical protein